MRKRLHNASPPSVAVTLAVRVFPLPSFFHLFTFYRDSSHLLPMYERATLRLLYSYCWNTGRSADSRRRPSSVNSTIKR